MIRRPALHPFSAAQGQPAPPASVRFAPWVAPAECGGENPFSFPLSDRADWSRVAIWIVACVVLGIAFNAAGIIAMMSAASDLSGN